MAKTLASYKNFRPRDYILGRVPLPPWIMSKRQRPFVFSGQKTIANGAASRVDIQIHDDAYFLVEGIQIISSDQSRTQDKATVQITDTSTGRNWSDKAVPLRDISGLGNNPKHLSDPNILRPSSSLAVQITNNTGASATFYVALVGRKIYGIAPAEAVLLHRRLWSQFVLNVPDLGASAVDQENTVQILKDSDFLVKQLNSSELINAIIGATPGAESAEVLFNIRDTSTDLQLFDNKIAARLVLGGLQGEAFSNANSFGHAHPFVLRKPWLLRRNGRINARFDNKSTDATGEFNIVLEGIKIFDPART